MIVVAAVATIAENAKKKTRLRRDADVMKPPVGNEPGPKGPARTFLERIVHCKLHVSPRQKRQRRRIARRRRHTSETRARLRRDRRYRALVQQVEHVDADSGLVPGCDSEFLPGACVKQMEVVIVARTERVDGNNDR